MSGRFQRFVDRIFRLEEINGGNTCPTYLYRWTLLSFGAYRLYVHHFVGDDWSNDLHHPKRFVTVGLRGGYVEETPCRCSDVVPLHPARHSRTYRAPWVRSFPADHAHRLRMIDGGDCWTLVVTLKQTRMWGFWRAGRFVPWRQYVNSPDAREHRSCP